MPKNNIPRLHTLELSQIREMVRDLHYFLRGYKVIVAADAHELVDYCFPANPLGKTKGIDAESLAESQAALNYLFKAGEADRPPVILLPEYQEELQRLRNAVFQRADEMYEVSEIIQAMIKAGDLRSATERQRADLESVVKKSFQFLLTILLGIHSYGVKRLDETYDHGLTSLEDAIEPEDRVNFGHILDNYTRSHLYDLIFNALQKDNRSDDAQEREKTTLANHFDASSIDRLIYLNSEADIASRGGLLTHKYLFLYVSTAPKSRKVFKEILGRGALPEIRGRRYSFWRNRHQVLAYLIYRSDGNNSQECAEKTIKALMSLHGLMQNVNKFKRLITDEANDCSECVLDDRQPTLCPLEHHCRELLSISNKIKEKREEVKNWGLFKQINSYADLLDAKVPQVVGYEVFMMLFEELLNSRGLKDIALERMYQTHVWISRATERMLLTHPHKEELKLMKDRDMRSEKDQVRGIYQYLPSKPRFRSAQYREIANLVIEFFRQPKCKDIREAAYEKFKAADPELGGEDEYDLLKCYLYLAFGLQEEKVHTYIKETLTPQIDAGEADDHMWCESLYIMCWSARRAGLYEEADRYAQDGSSQYPDDPRFLHGRALNIYTWRVLGTNCPHKINDAVTATERALELYRRPEWDSNEQVAASYNNLTYFLAVDVETSGNHDRAELTRKLQRAREHLNNLKSVINKETWNPTHPEFFHTEAFLEYQEGTHFWVGQTLGQEELKGKLRSAKKDIQTALSLYDCPKYQELRNKIDDFHRKTVSGTIK